MKKKGFTLIELQGVIILLAVVVLIALPLSLNLMKDAEEKTRQMINDNIQSASYEYIVSKPMEYRIINGSTFCIPIRDLIDENYIDKSTFENKVGKEFDLNQTVEVSIIDGKKEVNYNVTSNCSVVIPITCGELLTDSRDSNTYETVEIGEQCWFAEDLKYNCADAGYTNIGNATSWSGTSNCGNQGAGYEGMLYQWNVAMNGSTIEGSRGLCPAGWHIATDDEWKILEETMGIGQVDRDSIGWRGTDEGARLKSVIPSWGATNEIGFEAKPTGYRFNSGLIHNIDIVSIQWSSSLLEEKAWKRSVNANVSTINRSTLNQNYGLSVRCIMGN